MATLEVHIIKLGIMILECLADLGLNSKNSVAREILNKFYQFFLSRQYNAVLIFMDFSTTAWIHFLSLALCPSARYFPPRRK